jgi:hypothetical protein
MNWGQNDHKVKLMFRCMKNSFSLFLELLRLLTTFYTARRALKCKCSNNKFMV